MIDGVKVKKLNIFPDDRGFFAELLKFGEDTFIEVKQTSFTETYPGVIKAFHWHKEQTDVWFVAEGMARIVLYDLREDSATCGQTDVFCAGERNPLLILIPPGVAHGYQVLGAKPVRLFYHTDKVYDPQNPDEQRIAFNDEKIGFDWSIKNR